MTLSILMPVKDAESYLSECLRSIVEQGFTNWELIAVNDHSSDGSLAILKDFSKRDQRIKVMQNSGTGIISALRTAWLVSEGQLIHRMDADDKMPEHKLQTMVDLWEQGSVVTGKVKYFSDEWMVGLGFQNYEGWINNLMDKGHLWDDLYMECPIPSPAWLMHREDLQKIGAFDSDLLPEDYDLCFRVYEHRLQVITSQKILHLWRDSQSRTSRKNPVYFPMAYYPLKLHYFLKLERDDQRPLCLWGAGKKGKLLAKLLNQANIEFDWVTDNERKIGVDIHGVKLKPASIETMENSQIILAVASPEDKQKINATLEEWHLILAKDFWWFC